MRRPGSWSTPPGSSSPTITSSPSARSINVTTSDGKKLSARVLGQDASHDLAVLKVDGTNLPAVELGDSDQRSGR